ncbi:hypothetical protein M422DRAFT_270482 [Sphaerobolus stellatus SS14]|uniref:Uncharacterized protein n=1 Tax=Sphaerobolus stellatus (strain SS14) TaxID=990650 RepID=A0A0C9USP3_SPHS4|nr:hypothetical protein M422DRAFT_270482 [Sphaerobolus stellatus SS14]
MMMTIFNNSFSPEQPAKHNYAELASKSTVEEEIDWLPNGAQQQEFSCFKNQFEKEKCLTLTIDMPLELLETFWASETGLKFNIGEIAFLRKNLQTSVKKMECNNRKATKKLRY